MNTLPARLRRARVRAWRAGCGEQSREDALCQRWGRRFTPLRVPGIIAPTTFEAGRRIGRPSVAEKAGGQKSLEGRAVDDRAADHVAALAQEISRSDSTSSITIRRSSNSSAALRAR